MKRLQPAVWVALILAVNSVQAQTSTTPYRSPDASVYTDIIGELEPVDDWTFPTNKKAEAVSQASSSTIRSPGPPIPSNVEIFGRQPAPQPFIPQALPTDAGQLWENPAKENSDWWYNGRLRLQVGIDYLYFGRGAAADNFFASNDLGETFSLGDIDPGNDTTLRYRFLIADAGGTGFELLGYDFEEFNGSLRLDGEGITPEFFGGIPTEPAEAYDANYKSALTNYEANVWSRRSERLKIGFGLRYIELAEEFDIVSDTSTSTSTATTGQGTTTTTTTTNFGFFSGTENRIWGGQLMARVYRPIVNKFHLEAGANGGYGFNRISVDSDESTGSTAAISSQTEEDTNTGFFSFNGGVTYRPMKGFSLRAGYEGLLLTNIALSPDQSAAIDDFGAGGNIQTGSLYFSGAYFGGTISF